MKRAGFLAGTAFGAVLCLGVLAHANLGGATGVVIPYQGRLERNGAPLSNTVKLGFDIYNVASGGAPCFSTVPTDTVVFNGQFSTLIPVPSAKESCIKGQEVYLEVRVTAVPAPEVALGQRQRIYPNLAALTAGPQDFDVAGTLTAAAANILGSLRASVLSLGPNAPLAVFPPTANSFNRGLEFTNAGNATIYNDASSQMIGFHTNRHIYVQDYTSGVPYTAMDLDTSNGDVAFAGSAKVGYFYGTCDNATDCSCPAGTVILGGGASCAGVHVNGNFADLYESMPNSPTNWHAWCFFGVSGSAAAASTIRIVCARLGN